MGQEKYTEAQPLLVQGYEGIKQREALIRFEFSHFLPEAGERLLCFYEVTKQLEKARRLREELRSSRRSK